MITLFPFTFFIIILQQVNSTDSDPCTPQQIHLALSDAFTSNPTTNSPIKVIFHTQEECNTAYISLTTSQGTQNIQATSVNFFTDTYKDGVYSTNIHIFDFPELEFAQTYEYSCYGNDQNSFLQNYQGPFQFYLPNPYPNNTPTRVVMFGDMDASEDGLPTINSLKKIAQNNFTKISAYIHYGDISYDLYSQAGTVGDNYMNIVQEFTATMPYMVTAGNHEILHNFSNFNSRFKMPNFDQYQNHYYSFNLGNIHFTSFNLDLILLNPGLKKPMLAWLEKDLQNAQTSQWIVAYTHRPIYCSAQSEDCNQNHYRFSEFEDLLNKYNVSLLIAGHVHVYERMLPINKGEPTDFQHIPADENYNYIINPTSPVYVVQGKGGHKNDTAGPKGVYKGKEFTVKVDNSYSFLSVSSQNNTHLLVENFESENRTLNDYFYIIKNNTIDYQQVPLEDPDYAEEHDPKSAFKIGSNLFVLILIFFYIL